MTTAFRTKGITKSKICEVIHDGRRYYNKTDIQR